MPTSQIVLIIMIIFSLILSFIYLSGRGGILLTKVEKQEFNVKAVSRYMGKLMLMITLAFLFMLFETPFLSLVGGIIIFVAIVFLLIFMFTSKGFKNKEDNN